LCPFFLDTLRQLSIFRDLSKLIRVTDLGLGSDYDSEPLLSASGKQNDKLEMATAKQNIRSILALNRTSSRKKNEHHDKLYQKKGNSIIMDENMIDESTLNVENVFKAVDDGFTSAGERLAKNNSFSEIPRLDLDYIENIISWTYARLIFQNFGDRYRFRIDIYVGKLFQVILHHLLYFLFIFFIFTVALLVSSSFLLFFR
jgi:hypothetical protein